ncbi:SDR family NAD(P)-dependent oxidoreductase [Jannaschia sp. LMIT008]|uniref:SDR family NAD(P)-dependent oxidoreductase n=1 Tax=Jannaschia maritima TaxID=3032585 RepID=UPI002811E96E|nr:SDR family NAD(P)-dependent oxidoreductase [Jannaschia sp. LMIT008]
MARSILVTGCSSGIGRDAALHLHALGWRVFAACRKPADCDALRALGFAAPLIDYERPDTIASGLDAVLDATGGTLDALFNNGAYAIPGLVEDLPGPALSAILQANVVGWHDLTRRALPVMRARGQGRIVQCSSVLGFVAAPWRGAYVASKFALEGLTDTLRLELRGSGIHVSLIQPGPVRTAFRRNARAQFERWIDWRASPNADRYGALLERFGSEAPDRFEVPPRAVTDALLRALTDRRPRARYRVTAPTRVATIARRALSTRMLDTILSRN